MLSISLCGEAGGKIFDKEDIVLRDIDQKTLVNSLITCAGSFQGQARKRFIKGPSIERTTFIDFPILRLDMKLFELLIMNLYDNAVKYTYDKQRIIVSGKVKSDVVEIAITNYGIALTPEDVPTIFNRYSRAPQAKEFARVGTGVGLFICCQIAELHNGTITAVPSRTIYRKNGIKLRS